MQVSKELRNQRLLQTLEMVKANPQHWDQTHWHCGTSHCFAGFVHLLQKELPVDTSDDLMIKIFYTSEGRFRNTAKDWLGLTEEEADNLFYSFNTIEDLERIVAEIIAS
jgi:hypothetical protein